MLNNKGQTLVELAFVIMLLLVLVIGITEFSRAWNHTTVMTNGARAGARFAAALGHTTSYVRRVEDYTKFQVMTGLKVGPDDVFVSMSAFSSGFPNATSIPLRRTADPPLVAGNQVTVIVRHTFTGGGGSIVPIIRGPKNFVRKASMRYEGK